MRDFNKFASGNANVDKNSMDMIKQFAQKYEGASEERLISEIMLEAEKGRKNGTLTNADIERFRSAIYPMLNSKQREKLEKIVNTLKKN